MQELSSIEPAAARFDLDRLHKFSFSMQDLALTNPDITKRISEAKKEFRDDGAVHVWSTFRIENDIYVMNDKRGGEIIDYLDVRKYIILVKFIVNTEDDIWIIRDKRESVQKSGNNIILGKNSKPGILTGIDKPYYERSYPVTAVVYGLYPLNDKPDVKDLKKMKVSRINCVAERVIEHFTNAIRGNGLTDLRRNKINMWAEKVKDTGASISDVAELEKLLRFPITVKTLTGEILHKTKYKSRGASINIIDHNAHAWTNAVTVFPRERMVKFYHDDVFDAISDISKCDPVSMWLFQSSECDHYDQFVRSNGDIYRTESLYKEMENLALKYTSDDVKVRQLLSNCFTVPSVAAHFAQEKNSWKPTRLEFLEDVVKSCIEYGHGGLWNTKYNYNDVISVDMVACYPGSFLGYGECSKYFKRFGHPTHDMTRVAINGPLPEFD